MLLSIGKSYGQEGRLSPPDPASPTSEPSLREEILTQPSPQELGAPLLEQRLSTSSNLLLDALSGGQDTSRLLIAVSLKEEYSDNFDQENDNPQRESRTTLTLGTRYRVTGKGRYLSLVNTFDANYQANDRILNIGFANLALDIGYDFPRLSLALKDTFVRDDSLEEASSTGTRRERTKFWRNSFAPRVRFQVSRLASLELVYTNIVIGVEEGDQDDSVTDRIQVIFQQALTRTLKGRFSYSFTRGDDSSSDPEFEFALAADVTYDLTRNLSFIARASWAYNNREPQDTDALRYGSDLSVRYRLLPELSLVMGAGVQVFDDEEGDPETAFTWQFGLNGTLEIVPGTRLRLTSSQSIVNTQGDVEDVGIVRRLTFSAQLEQDISRFLRLQLLANTAFIESLEDEQTTASRGDRKEFFWRTGANLRYQLTRTWSLALQYEHRRRDANRAEDEFVENRVLFSITGGFSVL